MLPTLPPHTLFPGFSELVDPSLPFSLLGHISLAPPFLPTIAQSFCWAFLSSLSPLTLGDLLSLHLPLVLTCLKFPTQLMTHFLSSLNLFIFLMLTNTYGVDIVCLALC